MNIQQVLFRLATQDERDRGEIIQWLQSHATEAFAQQARWGKVAPAILRTLEIWHIDMPVLAPLKQFVSELVKQKQFYDLEKQDLAQSGQILPQSILILKGQALQRWYPRDLPPRQSLDMDLVIEDEAQYWQVGRWLVDRGYELPAMGAAYQDRSAQDSWRFIVTYEKKLPHAKSESIISLAMIELLQGATSVSLRHFFDLKPIIAHARDAVKLSSPEEEQINPFFLYPTREDCLIALLVEICERNLELRDAIDLHMLMGRGESNHTLMLNWSTLWKVIEEESLTIQFLRLASYYTSVSRFSLPTEIEQTYQRWQRQHFYWKYIVHNPELNLIALYYARRFHWTYVIREVLLNFWEAALDSSLFEKFSFRPQSTALSYDDVGHQQSLVRLLRLSNDQGNSRQWGKGKGGELLLRTPVGTFLATRSLDFSREFLENLCNQFPDDWNDSPKER